MARNTREQLVDFLDKRVFDPILDTSDDEFSSDKQKETFRHVRRSTESEKHRFHEEYTNAEDVKNNYLSDLSSDTGERITRESHELGLPTLPDVHDEFVQLCDKLNVK